VLSSEERRAQDLRATLQHINKFTAEKSPRIEKRMKTAIGIAKAPWSSPPQVKWHLLELKFIGFELEDRREHDLLVKSYMKEHGLVEAAEADKMEKLAEQARQERACLRAGQRRHNKRKQHVSQDARPYRFKRDGAGNSLVESRM